AGRGPRRRRGPRPRRGRGVPRPPPCPGAPPLSGRRVREQPPCPVLSYAFLCIPVWCRSVCCPGSQIGTSRRKEAMATLAFNHEEIVPRALKPALYELDGISRAAVEAHYKLYQGYVNKRNEILGKLAGVELAAANQVYSEIRGLKVDLSFAVGGIKNHEIYFEHLGGSGGDPDGAVGQLIERDFGSA